MSYYIGWHTMLSAWITQKRYRIVIFVLSDGEATIPKEDDEGTSVFFCHP